MWFPVSMLALLLAATAAGADLKCVTCHVQEGRSQPLTPMANALQSPGSDAALSDHPAMVFRKGAYTYRVTTHGDSATYSVSDGVREISAPLRWAFGERNQTFVLEHEGKMYEGLATYYSEIGGLDLTLGDEALHPTTLLAAFGREISHGEATACFGCHSSRGVDHETIAFDKLVAGVTCDHCHAGALQHQESALHGKRDNLPPDLSAKKPFEISEFCGQCHRTWETIMRMPVHGEIDVRFQPYRLANSKCYDGGDKRLSCVTCHNPHSPELPKPALVDSKCTACHSASNAPAITSCKVGTSQCASCHMPKIDLPGGHKLFTDHQIRIVRAGEPYPN